MSDKKIRALAVVLPQFHPIPENDVWWGKGFTEWTNVSKATPRYDGHYQPHIPADLGFYDLRLEQTRLDQAKLAQSHNIYGFCYFHYWFNGKQLLETPVNRILETQKPDMPFMLCWANENWSRRWDGLDQEVLIQQYYSAEDHENHAAYLCEKVFSDNRYIKIDGKPFFLFYNSDIIPDIENTIKIWRNVAKKYGFKDLYLGGIRTSSEKLPDAQLLGFDVAIEWQPDWSCLNTTSSFVDRIKNKIGVGSTFRKLDYDEAVRRMLLKPKPQDHHFQCITPAWDNCARKKQNAFLLHNSTPETYGYWLSELCKKVELRSKEENFVFINAWNEWAEGNHLEPDKKWGNAYLEKTKLVLEKYL